MSVLQKQILEILDDFSPIPYVVGAGVGAMGAILATMHIAKEDICSEKSFQKIEAKIKELEMTGDKAKAKRLKKFYFNQRSECLDLESNQ